jgi:hypothetical protein
LQHHIAWRYTDGGSSALSSGSKSKPREKPTKGGDKLNTFKLKVQAVYSSETHGVTTQLTALFIITAVITSNPIILVF